MAQYLDKDGLAYVLSKLKGYIQNPIVKTTQQWSEVTEAPKLGDLVIYSDAPIGIDNSGNVITGVRIKVGDGSTLAKDLPFTSQEPTKNQPLTIGDLVYDGSEAVTVPIYDGTESFV